jgi:hypothetical protein
VCLLLNLLSCRWGAFDSSPEVTVGLRRQENREQAVLSVMGRQGYHTDSTAHMVGAV